MRKATDTALRYLAMLRHIPAHPKTISARELVEKLRAQEIEYGVDIRTIQRDLEKLSQVFPLTAEKHGRAIHWCYSVQNEYQQIPAMNHHTALAFLLAAEHLTTLMPPAYLRLLDAYFRHAEKTLRGTKLNKWRNKTRIIARGPELSAPPVKPKVQEVVYEALLENKQFETTYQSRDGGAMRQTLHPLGLVIRAGVIYMVATSGHYADPRHFALHRMRRAVLLNARAAAPAGFNFARYVEEEKSFSYPLTGARIKLRALFAPGAAVHLSESKLSADQKMIDKKDGRVLVEASVADTAELRWWLRGFGPLVEALAPAGLRGEFVKLAGEMGRVYRR